MFGDIGENSGNTITNVAKSAGGLILPNLEKIGLGQIADLGHPPVEAAGCFGRCREISMGKDTVTGHWEMMGIHTEVAFPTYPHGFPLEVIEPFEAAVGCQALGNVPASGTEIIKQLGEEHLRTGCPIVYTSADSVFQVAAHEEHFGLQQLYDVCAIARKQLTAPNNVARVIARPFIGESADTFKRTENRRDYPLAAPPNVLDNLAAKGIRSYAVGVICEVFSMRGFSGGKRTQDNQEHFKELKKAMAGDWQFIFANFEDFDMLYGHRNDPLGFADCLRQFDDMLGTIMGYLRPADLLIITADHGNDPTTPSTDHSREYTPLLAYSPSLKAGKDLGVRTTMADIGATIADAFQVSSPTGTSFLAICLPQ